MLAWKRTTYLQSTRNLQQEWFKGYQKCIDRFQDSDEKKAHQDEAAHENGLLSALREVTVKHPS